MGDAPSLPAQTPGMLVGAGGDAPVLSGQCAEAAADCGLSETDFAPLEQVISVVRAAQERCRAYDDARWLEERERYFEFDDARVMREEDERLRLLKQPTARERHLAQCVAAPYLSPSYFQTRQGDASTNARPIPSEGLAGARGFDLRRAPAAPRPCGLSLRVAANHAVSALSAVLVDPGGPRKPGRFVHPDELEELRADRIREVLRAAGDEDEPRLRSCDLMSSRRPRQVESERRDIEQVLPDAPQLASAGSFTADGAESVDDPILTSDVASPSERRASGCVASVAAAQQRAMQEDVSSAYTGGFVEAEREALASEREAERHHEVCRRQLERASRLASVPLKDSDQTNLDRRALAAAETETLRAAASLQLARASAVSIPALRIQALELSTGTSPVGETSGHVPLRRSEAEPDDIAVMWTDG